MTLLKWWFRWWKTRVGILPNTTMSRRLLRFSNVLPYANPRFKVNANIQLNDLTMRRKTRNFFIFYYIFFFICIINIFTNLFFQPRYNFSNKHLWFYKFLFYFQTHQLLFTSWYLHHLTLVFFFFILTFYFFYSNTL